MNKNLKHLKPISGFINESESAGHKYTADISDDELRNLIAYITNDGEVKWRKVPSDYMDDYVSEFAEGHDIVDDDEFENYDEAIEEIKARLNTLAKGK